MGNCQAVEAAFSWQSKLRKERERERAGSCLGGRGQNRKETANEACFNNRIDGVQEKMLCTSMISIPWQTLEGVGERMGGW